MTTAFAGSTAAQVAVEIDDGPVEYTETTAGSNYAVQVSFDDPDPANNPGNYNFIVEDRSGTNTTIPTAQVSAVDAAAGTIKLDLDGAGVGNLAGDATLYVEDAAGNSLDDEEIQTTSSTVTEAGAQDTAAYKGEWVAAVADNTGNPYEVFTDGDFQFSGNTGDLSVAAENTSTAEFEVGEDSEFVFTDSGSAANVTVRNLGLDVEPEDDEYESTTGKVTIEFTVTSNVAGRTVDATLFYANNDSEANESFDGVAVGSSREFEGKFEGVNDGPDYYIEVEDVETGITATTDDIPVDEVEGEASFTTRSFTEERGDTVNLTINIDNNDEATVFLGSDDIGYLSMFNVSDGNDDGFVAVQINTFTEGTTAGGAVTAYNPDGRDSDDHDEVTDYQLFTDQLDADEPLASGSYDLNATVKGENENVATLQLNERSIESARTWIAPGDANTGNVSQIQENSVQMSRTARGSKVVIQVQASGLYAFLNTPLTPQRARSLADPNPGVYMEIEQTDTTGNVQAKQVDMANVSYELDEDNNQFFVVLDTGRNGEIMGGDGWEDGETYEATFIVNETSPYVESTTEAETEEETVSTTFTIQEPRISVEGEEEDSLNVSQGNVTLSGTTNLAPGSELSVEVRSTTSGVPFLLTAPEVPVSEDGTWSTTLDMSEVPTGSTYDVTIRVVGGTPGDVDNIPVELTGTVLGAPTASVTFDDQSSNGEVVIVQSVTLSRGGFVAIHEGDASGPVIGSSRYLGPGTHENVRIALDEAISEDGTLVAMPHLDTNGNNVYEFPDADGPYTADGAPVTDDAAITIQAGGTVVVTRDTPTPRVVTRTVVQDTPEPRTVVQTRTVVRTQTPGQPGFGIAIAIVALLAAALLAVRRRD